MNTIISCSSGNETNVAISLIRICGFDSINQFKKYFSIGLENIKPKYSYLTKIYDENKNILDEVTLLYFKGPKSYNGENIIELGVHGNKLNVRNIINLFISNNLARMAEPGEFTLRALKNKKLSLSQVEGLDLLLNAEHLYGVGEGLSLLNGSLNKEYIELSESFDLFRSYIELAMDFSDDVGEEALNSNIKSSFDNFFNLLRCLNKRAVLGDRNLSTLDVCIYGAPNAGKSTFFNSIVSRKRAIVSGIEGTTRDYITEYIEFKGAEFRLIDTAGIRESCDQIEKIGIESSINLVENSFFKVKTFNAIEINNDIDNVQCDSDLIVISDWKKLTKAYVNKLLINELFTGKTIFFVDINSEGFHELDWVLMGQENDNLKEMNNNCVYIKSSKSLPVGEIQRLEIYNSLNCSTVLADQNSGPIGPEDKNSGPIGPGDKNSGPIGPEDKNSGPIGPLGVIKSKARSDGRSEKGLSVSKV